MSANDEALAFAQRSSSHDGEFDQRKRKIVQDLAGNLNDLSPKGNVDEPVLPLVELLNTHPDYVTTSSCSGRISCHVVDEAANKGGRWAYISHSLDDPHHIVSQLLADVGSDENPDQAQTSTNFKFEPFVLHCECRSLVAATGLLAVAIGAGFRESGIMNADKRVMLAVRGSLRIEAPVAVGSELLVPESYLLHLAQLGNSKLEENLKRIEKFYTAVAAWLTARSEQQEEAAAEASPLGLVVQGRVVEQLRIALDRRGWLDGTRGIGGAGAGEVGIPLTRAAAEELQGALGENSAEESEDEIVQMILSGGGGRVEPVRLCLICRILIACLQQVEDRAPGKQKRRATPYQKLQSSCTELLRGLSDQECAAMMDQVPKKWEAMGDLVLLPADSFTDQSKWEELAGGRELMWPKVSAALKVRLL